MGVGQSAGCDHLISMTVDQAFAEYEVARHVLPPARAVLNAPRHHESLADIADDFDVFLLDAFGVLNIGDSAIPGVPERVADLLAAGKRIIVVSNAASVPVTALARKYQAFGYPFEEEDIVSSRMALIAGLQDAPQRLWGVMGGDSEGLDDLALAHHVPLLDKAADYAHAEGFLLVGSATWTEARQTLLEASLLENPRPVLVANPDIIAPRDTGSSAEPGYFAHRLSRATGITPRLYGKPFANIFDLAFAKLGAFDPKRTLMVGDSLHTDVLGAHAVGVSSALISDYGFFAEGDAVQAMQVSGIAPDFVLARP